MKTKGEPSVKILPVENKLFIHVFWLVKEE